MRPPRSADALPVATATTELVKHSGTQFDPRVVDALLAVVRSGAHAAPLLPAS